MFTYIADCKFFCERVAYACMYTAINGAPTSVALGVAIVLAVIKFTNDGKIQFCVPIFTN